MKKTVFYLFAFLCFISVLFVSCEPKENNKDFYEGVEPKDSVEVVVPETEDDNKTEDDTKPEYENAIKLVALGSEYSTGEEMGYSSAVSHSFLLLFATEECEVSNGKPFGSGDILALELCSATADNMLPALGTYPITDKIADGNIISGFDFNGTPIGTYVYKMVEDEMIGFDCVYTGGVEIRKGDKEGELEFFIYVVFESGEERYYYYKGEMLIEHIGVR